jgi:hypothetical protein
MSVLACQLIDVLLYLVGNVVIFFSSLYLLRSSFEATSFYIIYLLIITVGKTTEILCENTKVLLFEYEECRGPIFGNYNIDNNLRAFM